MKTPEKNMRKPKKAKGGISIRVFCEYPAAENL